MKYLIIIFFLLNFVSMSCYSQDNSNRILEIKKMYGDIININNSNNAKQCKTHKIINYEGFDETSEKMPFDQIAEHCKVSNEYNTYKAKFSGYEWNNETIFYLKDNKIFFVFISSSSEACSNEYRLYYDLTGKVIKILNKSNDCNGDKPIKSSEIIDKDQAKGIVEGINTDFNKALQILK
jgi:hypothetical protein